MVKTSTWSWAMTRNGSGRNDRGGQTKPNKCYGSVMEGSYKRGLKVMVLEGKRNAIKNVTN